MSTCLTWVMRGRRPAAVAGVLAMVVGTAGCNRTGTRDNSAGDDPAPPPATDATTRVEFDLFAFGRVLGTLEPCGCTTEPLGGLQYAFGFITEQSDDGAFAVVEPGSFLFPDPTGPEPPKTEPAWAQAMQRAKALQKRFSALGPALASGVGPTDVASPQAAAALAAHPMPRVIANAAQDAENAPLSEAPPHRIVHLQRGGLSLDLGVTAVVDPSVAGVESLGPLQPAAGALKQAVARMKGAGADVTVALVHGPRELAESIAREVDVDIVVVGVVDGLERQRLGTPMAKLGDTFVLEPGEQMQTVTHMTLSIGSNQSEVPEASSWTVVPPRSAVQTELARVEERLAKFKADPDADAAFIRRLEQERDRLSQQLDGEPSGDAVVTFEQVKITCKKPVDEAGKTALAAYDAWIAQSNKKRFAGVTPPPPAKGEPGYVGRDACAECHDEAIEHWETTRHAGAYETLVEANKQFDLSCVGCHVTGFREPGGSEVVETRGLVDVQCEVCHGAGSIHAEDPDTANIVTEVPESVCGQCHTPEHSDTFDYQAYLRDILGKGHGPTARKALGDGPTGRELRAAGLAEAGGGCKKM